MNFSKIRLITFDITGTLLQFSQSPGKQYAKVGAMYGVVCDHDLLSSNFKNHWRKMTLEHPNFGRHSGLGWENWWRRLVFHTFKDTKHIISDEKLHQVAEHLIEEYKSRHYWKISGGALDLLSYLLHKGYVLGVISNYDPRLHALLENNKLQHYFRFVLTSYDVGVEKPHPEIFEEAIRASKIKNIKAGECLHIGDNVPFDYLGAINAGWNAAIIVAKDRAIHSESSDIDRNHMFYSLYDLHKHVITSNGQSLRHSFNNLNK